MQELTAAVLAGVVSGLLVELILRVRVLLHRRRLRLLMNFHRSRDLMFLYPPRYENSSVNPRSSTSVLPRASTEDFMGVNNLISALLSIGWNSDRFVIRDTERCTEQQLENAQAILLCSSKSNSFTRKLQKKLLEDSIRHYHFVQLALSDPKSDSSDSESQWAVTDGDGFYPSPVTKALKQYGEGQTDQREQESNTNVPLQIHERSFVDFAVVTKVRNPWKRENQILIIAGVRAIGTWGAAETVKKWYDLIYKAKKGLLQGSRKDGGFSALLRIHYHNSDIVDAEVMGMIDINM